MPDPEASAGVGANWVVGTAGHVDHGKTSLIRALTGVDLDTRPEERSRGITIALGFVPMDLPDGRRVAFVDVPGHERLVRTMIAGATGIDAALLCVSSQDGVMPQTREHLAILDLLGVRQGIIAMTKADLVDEELLELAMEEVAEEVEGTFLEGCPIVPVSSITGTGLDDLTEAIAALGVEQLESDGPFRLPVDRSFSRSGFGTVATGTAWSGHLRVGDSVTLLPRGTEARVRGLQTHGHPADEVRAGWRVAINLSGVDVDEVSRGVVVTTGKVPTSSMIDVRLRMLDSAPELADGASVRFLVGTTEGLGKVHLAVDADTLEPGAEVWAQVRLEAPVPVLPGDRFILRRTSPMDTLGGGEVVDPWAPRLRRNRRVRHGEEAAALHAGDLSIWLLRAGEEGLLDSAWRARPGTTAALGHGIGDRRFADAIVERLEGIIDSSLAAFHAENPLLRGAGRRELLRGRLGHLDAKVFDALLKRRVQAGVIELDGSLIRRTGFEPVLSPAHQQTLARLEAAFSAAGLEGLTLKKVLEAVPSDATESLIRLMEHRGALVAVPQAGWLDAAGVAKLKTRLDEHFAAHVLLETAAFKDISGLPRRVAIPLLEWMDAQGWTRRVEGGRVRGTEPA